MRHFIILLLLVLLLISCQENTDTGTNVNVTKISSEVGDEAPNFMVENQEGDYFELKEFRGKPVVVMFWATWCSICKAEMPEVKTYWDGNKSSFTLIGVALENNGTTNLMNYIEDNNLEWNNAADLSRNISSMYKVPGTPTFVVIDAEGIIKYRTAGRFSTTLQSELEACFK